MGLNNGTEYISENDLNKIPFMGESLNAVSLDADMLDASTLLDNASALIEDVENLLTPIQNA